MAALVGITERGHRVFGVVTPPPPVIIGGGGWAISMQRIEESRPI
jgi:hypothetical protein